MPFAPALSKAFAILDLVSRDRGVSFTQIQKGTGLAKSSTHQLIANLRQLGALHQMPDGNYVLGLRLFELGSLAANQRGVDQQALPFLRALAEEVQLTCHLGVLEGREAVYLAKVEGDLAIKVNTWVGKRLSLYSSSLGKALLAWLPEAQLDEIIATLEWNRKTATTIIGVDALKEHLALVRAKGWAIDDEEDIPNIRCVSAPVRDMRGTVVAAISVVGTTIQVGPDRFPILAHRVCAVADEISQALGHR
jgi:DNA-binding IclR family transcriptional regulator